MYVLEGLEDTYDQEYTIERKGEYPTSQHFTGGHDLCNDIHKLEASDLAVCGHVAKPHVR